MCWCFFIGFGILFSHLTVPVLCCSSLPTPRRSQIYLWSRSHLNFRPKHPIGTLTVKSSASRASHTISYSGYRYPHLPGKDLLSHIDLVFKIQSSSPYHLFLLVLSFRNILVAMQLVKKWLQRAIKPGMVV